MPHDLTDLAFSTVLAFASAWAGVSLHNWLAFRRWKREFNRTFLARNPQLAALIRERTDHAA
jgi:hypothetical protein